MLKIKCFKKEVPIISGFGRNDRFRSLVRRIRDRKDESGSRRMTDGAIRRGPIRSGKQPVVVSVGLRQTRQDLRREVSSSFAF